MGGLHPRAAGLAPTWRARDGFFQPELVGKVGRVLKRVFPFRSHVNETLVHQSWCVQRGIKILKTSDSHALHPFEVELDTFLGDVPVHPVPPDAGLSAIRRVQESTLECVAGGLPVRAKHQKNCQYEKQRTQFQNFPSPGHASPRSVFLKTGFFGTEELAGGPTPLGMLSLHFSSALKAVLI